VAREPPACQTPHPKSVRRHPRGCDRAPRLGVRGARRRSAVERRRKGAAEGLSELRADAPRGVHRRPLVQLWRLRRHGDRNRAVRGRSLAGHAILVQPATAGLLPAERADGRLAVLHGRSVVRIHGPLRAERPGLLHVHVGRVAGLAHRADRRVPHHGSTRWFELRGVRRALSLDVRVRVLRHVPFARVDLRSGHQDLEHAVVFVHSVAARRRRRRPRLGRRLAAARTGAVIKGVGGAARRARAAARPTCRCSARALPRAATATSPASSRRAR